MKLTFTLLLSFTTFILAAQNITQTLRGEVKDALTQQPIEGVTVTLPMNENVETVQKITAADGTFSFPEMPVGRYRLRADYLGYQSLTVAEILLESGKETVLDIELTKTESYDLPPATVKSPRAKTTHPVSIKTLTIEETLRFPATYFDPARLALALPGVVNTNDQSNGISVRGNSPNALLWRLEGAEIVNPNHTPNAGTVTDRITLNGGGVNMLSAQMLGTTTFLTGAFPAPYGNALGGIMDLNLRKPNFKEHEFTAQIGLIGIDLAAEGPFGNNEKSAFAANYRYSTVGLLSDLGVDLGDEEISFTDLAFKADFLTKKGGKFSVFGVGGRSKNLFAAQRDTAVWEFEKDRFDIDFNSQTAIGGISYGQPVGKDAFFKTTLVHSVTENTRTGLRLDDNFNGTLQENDSLTYAKTALHTEYTKRLSARNRLLLGLDAVLHDFSVLSEDFGRRLFAGGEGSGVLWQPFVQMSHRFNEKWTADVGLHFSYFDYNNTQALEPRAALRYGIDERQSLSLAYGRHSQLQSPQLYTARTVTDGSNENLELTKAHHFVLGYQLQKDNGNVFLIETYYQQLFDVPEPFAGGTSFSALNLFESYTTEPLRSTGNGRNIGAEISWQKYFTNDFYYLLNTSVYDAKYTDANGVTRNNRFNGNYILNATGGKEWKKIKDNKTKIFGINVRVGYAGGFRYTPIDIEASRAAGTTVFREDLAFSEQFPAYFKTDLRLVWKKNKPGRNTIWALDIQNATNQENAGFRTFDSEKGEVVTKNQLGLLPILSWKVEF